MIRINLFLCIHSLDKTGVFWSSGYCWGLLYKAFQSLRLVSFLNIIPFIFLSLYYHILYSDIKNQKLERKDRREFWMSALPLSLQRYLHLIMLKSRSCLPLPYLRVYRVRDTPLVKRLQVPSCWFTSRKDSLLLFSLYITSYYPPNHISVIWTTMLYSSLRPKNINIPSN